MSSAAIFTPGLAPADDGACRDAGAYQHKNECTDFVTIVAGRSGLEDIALHQINPRKGKYHCGQRDIPESGALRAGVCLRIRGRRRSIRQVLVNPVRS